MNFVETYSLHDIAPGKSRPVRIGTTDIVLFNVDGAIHALENACLHGGAALSGGRLCGKVVACPAHGWRYDVTSGALLIAPEKGLKTFPVRIDDGKIFVQVEA
ncbi:Rieske (2Fe-2S) protein [Dechloromonas hortensis]|uniref:Rieske (2Fe-2S) protein n=1 Tax=Dechloromonas hortensis TaxID=337779 RepID=UPI001290CA10|nr:Rieske (2Fe-2S) protein [Dechloromonas hortensis]